MQLLAPGVALLAVTASVWTRGFRHPIGPRPPTAVKSDVPLSDDGGSGAAGSLNGAEHCCFGAAPT